MTNFDSMLDEIDNF
jgi:hypothetical protein